MRIAFLCHNIFTNGGVQRVVTTLSNMLSDKYEIDIICTNTSVKIDRNKYNLSSKVNIIYEDIEENNKFKIFLLRGLRAINKHTGIFNNFFMDKILTRIYYTKKQQDNLINLVNKSRYDILIGCEGYYAILVALISKKIKAKTIAWQHNSYEAYFETKNKYCWNKSQLFKNHLSKVSKNIVLTNHDKAKYKNNFNIESKVIYNPLSFHKDEKTTLDKKVIVAAGRLSMQKGFDNLIEAFNIANKDNQWNLHIIGDGEEKENLIKKIKDLNLQDNVVLKPFNNKIEEEFLASSIYAMSSRWEGFGLVVTEALECGLPVVAFDVSGPKEILEGHQCGILVEQNNIKAYAKALEELMKDEVRRKKYSLSAIKRAKDFSEKKILEQWEEVFFENIYTLGENKNEEFYN